MKTYGVINKEGHYVELSKTIRGAKIYATKNGYTQVAYRHSPVCVMVVAQKDRNGNWY